MPIPQKPKLRLLEPMWVEHMGQRFLHLRDPIAMSGSTIMLPAPLAPLVMFMDGSRDLREIRSAMALGAGAESD